MVLTRANTGPEAVDLVCQLLLDSIGHGPQRIESVKTGKCGPCCSHAAMGAMTSVRSPDKPRIRGAVSSANRMSGQPESLISKKMAIV